MRARAVTFAGLPPVCLFRDVLPFVLAVAWSQLLMGAPLPGPVLPVENGRQSTTTEPTQEYFARLWTVDEGLPNNAVSRIIQDQRGYLWIATGGGLVRFDGKKFKEYPVSPLSPAANPNIRDVAEGASGSLVILSGNGGVIQSREGVFSAHAADATVSTKNPSRLFAEPNGALWITTGGQELIRWHEGHSEIFLRGDVLPTSRGRFHFAIDGAKQLWISGGAYLGRYHEGQMIRWPEPVGTNVVIAPAKTGGLWVWASEQLRKLEGGKLVNVAAGPAWSALAQHSVQHLHEDREGNLWIGTWRKGLFCLSARGLEAVPTPAASITSILQDREDNIWVGTSTGGVSMLRRKTFVTLDGDSSQADGVRTSICEDASGALWWTNRTNGLARLFAGQLTYYPLPGDLDARRYIYLVCPDRSGQVWVATSTGLYTISSQSPTELTLVSSSFRDVRVLVCARNGDVWICSGESDVGYFRAGIYHPSEPDTAFSQQRVRAIAEDANGGVWIATNNRDLYQFSDGKFVQRFSGQQVPGGIANALIIDQEGFFWMTTSRGLVLRRGTEARHFGTAEGLSDETISQLVLDNNERLWFANRRGLCAISLENLRALAAGKRDRVTEATLGKADGLPRVSALTGRAPTAWKAQDGRLWFSMHQGFAGVDPAQSFPQRSPPPVYIDALEVDRHPTDLGAPLRLNAGAHQLTFKFSAVSFYAPEKVRMRHQLVGFNAGWEETSTDHTATYAQLRPGSYRMRVAACNEHGHWNETITPFAIVIPPAWWQTWMFLAAAALALALAFGGLVRYWSQRRLRARLEKLEREHQLERERARIARDLHDELGYSVTQIGLIADRLKSEATVATFREGLGELTSCTRRLSGELEGVVWTVSPKNDQWNRLASYIRQFALNFFADTPIACTVEGVESAPASPLAPEVQHHLLAIVKEALNNTLKHARATRVLITIAFDAHRMSLRIADDGIGFNPAAMEHSERNGLTNLRARAGEIGGKLEIVSAPGTGTELRLSVEMNAVAVPHDHSQL